MMFFVYALLPALAFGASLDYGGSSSGGTNDGYGYGTETKCTPYQDVVFNDRCEAYTDRVCHTRQQESCVDVPLQNCQAQVTSRQVRKCFNVTELHCTLREDVQFEVVQVPVAVQKCRKVSERICDTVYDISFSNKDDFRCLNVQNPVCQNEERTVFEKTCRTTTTFDCEAGGYGAAAGANLAAGNLASGSLVGGSAAGGYGAGAAANAGFSSGDSYSAPAPPSYGAPVEPKCRRSQDTKCHKTPRTVFVQNCNSNQDKVCEKLSEQFPVAQERQNCRNEEKKVCELQQRTQPKQVKKYVYSKQCRPVPRRLCENAESKQLVPSCVGSSRKECSYRPVEQCEDIPKQHCFQVATPVKKERCETVQVGGGAAVSAGNVGNSFSQAASSSAFTSGGSGNNNAGGVYGDSTNEGY